jgi:hypothetical protein
MNLIQQQTAAKDLPLQYLQQAVNGQNPNMPPWIATAELQRRTTMNQHMQAAKGPQGPQPTVKDQIEQKAGLMATQAAQQAQAQQAQQSAPPQGPVPEGIPQPQPQPQDPTQQPVQAAHGGLMNAPVHFKFAKGGILGFAGGGDTEAALAAVNQSMPDPNVDPSGFERFGRSMSEYLAARQKAINAVINNTTAPETRSAEVEAATWPNRTRTAPSAPPTPVASLQHPISVPSDDTETAPAVRNPLAAAARAKAASPAAPTRNPLAQAAAPGTVTPIDPTAQATYQAAMNKYLNAPAPDTTVQGAVGQQKELAKQFGTDQPVGTEERAMLAKQQAATDAYAKNEQPYMNFARLAAGSIGVPGSAGLQYAESVQNAHANNMAQQQNQLKNIAELNAAQRTANMAQQTGAASTLSGNQTRAMEQAKGQAQVATQGYGDLLRTTMEKYTNDQTARTNLQIAKMHDDVLRSGQNNALAQQRIMQLGQMQQGAEADVKNLTALYTSAAKTSGPDGADTLQFKAMLNNAMTVADNIRAAQGIKTGVGTAPVAGASTILKYDANGKRIQ